jgi:HEAT repeat protein
MVGVEVFGYFILDNVFYDFTGKRFPGEAAFALFYGTYSAAVNLVCLIMLGFVTNRVMGRFGVGICLLMLPAALLLVVVAANGVHFSGGYAVVLLCLVVAGKFLDDVLRPCFSAASVNVLYQALPKQFRSRARSLSDGVIYPICAGLAGLLLLVLTTLAGVDANGLLILLLVILGIFCVIARRIPAAYRVSLKSALEKRSLDGLSLLPTDAATASMLESGLLDESPSRVLYCLDLLVERRPDSVDDALVALLGHSSDLVRRTALTRITDHSVMSALPEVRRLSISDSSPAVRAAAVLTLAALLESESVDALQPHLESRDPLVQQSAVIGLLRSGGIEGVLAAGAYLLDMTRNTDPSQRAQAAVIIGAVGIPSFHMPLRALLVDEAIEVQRAALASARTLGTSRLIDDVARCLGVPGLRRPAASALVAMGDAAIPRILEIYRDASSDPALRELLLGTLGQMGGESARNALQSQLETHRAPERASLAAALLSAGLRAVQEPALIHQAMKAAGRDSAWALSAAHQLHSRDEASVLAKSLLQFVDRQCHAMLSLAGCLHPAELLKRVRSLLDWPAAEMRAFAVELLDNTLASSEKAMLLPLIDGSDRNRQRSQLEKQFPVSQRSADEWFKLIATGDVVPASRWLRCAALHELARTGDAAHRDFVHRLIVDQDPVVSNSAQLATAVWDGVEGQERSASMLSIVERVIFLKAIPIFAEIPEADLAELADRFGEQRVSAGATIVSEGDLGTSMYMVVSGNVRVHRDDVEIDRMGEGSVFGELAALDTQPRSASVTALDETLLFSVNQEALYEIMAEHPVMLRGIIKVLCDRIRRRTSEQD